MRLSVNRKLLFEGIGKVYNCTCHDYNHPKNRYHTQDCASFANMTYTHHLTPTQRLKARFMPTSRDLDIDELKKLNIQV